MTETRRPAAIRGNSRNANGRCVRVSRDGQGVLLLDYSQCNAITLEMAERVLVLHRKLAAARKSPLLLLGGRVGHVEYAAQRFASSPQVVALTAALAIVVESFLTRHLARMFLVYHRPPYPVRVFGNSDEARAWLLRVHPPQAGS